MKIVLTSILVFIQLVGFAGGEMRAWKSADGERSLQAELLERDESNVTLRNQKGSVITFSIEKLHQDDQAFLESNHPYVSPEGEKEPEGDAFGPLRFGDSRNEVEKKLLASSIVKTEVNNDLFGRTGLNGIFETSESIGGLHCFLYFDWNEAGNLQEVTLRTKALGAASYNSTLQATWNELIKLLDKLYGNPISMAPYPAQKELQDGLMLSSHLWRTSDGYSVLLGTGQEQSDYSVSVRFTTKRIKPVTTP